jgi:nascent polypeptide-associated complex subunit beta
MGVNTIPGIEEVAFMMEDNTVQVFNNPKVQASIAANTYVVSGPSSVKTGHEALASMIGGGLGGMTTGQLQQLMAQMGGMPGLGGMPGVGGGEDEDGDDDEDVPDLVGNFDQAE